MTDAIKKTLYRGEHGPIDSNLDFQSRLGSISFGSVKAARTYAETPNNRDDEAVDPRVIKASITINNPILNNPTDPFVDLFELRPHIGEQKLLEMATDLESHLLNTSNFLEILEEHNCDSLNDLVNAQGLAILDELYVDAYTVFDNPKYIEWFKEAGFDGVVHQGAGETMDEPEYKIFDPEQAQVLHVLRLRQKYQAAPSIGE